MFCTACGRELLQGNRFCIYCGNPVHMDESVPPAANEVESNLVVLNDEYGNEIKFEFLDLIQYRGNDYVVLMPLDEDSQEVVILQIEYEDENENYVSVENSATLNAVFAIFQERNKDEFNFS